MKKFKFTINGNIYDVELGNIEDNIAQVSVNGTTFDVQIDRSINQQKTPKLVRSSTVPASDGGKPKTSVADKDKGVGVLICPLPGTIIEIHVKVGDKVTVGQKIITLEAMKMENVLHAQKEGVVESISCSNREPVKEGDVLMVIGD
jgi:glutaconyl-CoA/methylmalonyl-CoA decarboxylase subunit gamma